MKIPDFLTKNDKIGIVAPARSVISAEIEEAVNVLGKAGLQVVLGKNLFGKENQFSGTDKERAEDIQEFLDNDEIKAILCTRGGYGSIRLLSLLNWDKFVNKPKWFVGYSDITVFHTFINNQNIASLHAPMIFNLSRPDFNRDCFSSMLEILFGNLKNIYFESHPLNIPGKAKGRLVGGNLSVIYSLRGTPADLKLKNCILFIEDIDEYLYHIDRMMMNLKYGGALDQLRGIIVGGMTDMKDNTVPFGLNANEIIASHVKDLGIPVCFGFPAGHDNTNEPLVFGQEVILEVEKNSSLQFYRE